MCLRSQRQNISLGALGVVRGAVVMNVSPTQYIYQFFYTTSS
jgi:hypothetical protein